MSPSRVSSALLIGLILVLNLGAKVRIIFGICKFLGTGNEEILLFYTKLLLRAGDEVDSIDTRKAGGEG